MKFKLVSLSQSLDYERRGREKRVPVVNAMSNSVRQSLLDAETAAKSRSRYRQLYLRNIHDREVDDFVARGGLGVVRAPVITPGVDDIDIALPANATPLAVTTTSFRDPTQVHSGVAAEFTRPETFGYVKSKDQVAGFVPHHVAALPESDASPSTERWKLVRLQLVSLMRFESPRVYDSSDLPRMDVLRRALHRAPNEFEARSLPKLAHDQDVIIKESSGQILMLGAIRARQDCLQCHSVVRGELLGAFSYEFIHSGDGEPT